MSSKILVLAAATMLMAGGAAHAQSYDGTPPYGSGGYGYANYNGGDCDGFTIVGAHAGVTVLGINVGAGGRARIGGDCRGGGGQAYAPPQPYQGAGYQQQGYQDQGGAYYGQPQYGQVQYAQPQYVQPVYAPVYAAPAAYGYAQPVYVQPAPCGCGQAYGYAPGY